MLLLNQHWYMVLLAWITMHMCGSIIGVVITPIIKRYAEEYDLPYTFYPFYHAVRSHFRMLKNHGVKENIMITGEI